MQLLSDFIVSQRSGSKQTDRFLPHASSFGCSRAISRNVRLAMWSLHASLAVVLCALLPKLVLASWSYSYMARAVGPNNICQVDAGGYVSCTGDTLRTPGRTSRFLSGVICCQAMTRLVW